MKISKKQKELHLFSVFGFVFTALCFWLLGGAEGAGSVEHADEYYVNTALPEASDKELANSRLGAIRRAEDIESKESRRRNMQNTSFDWFDAAGAAKKDAKEQEPLPQVNVNTSLPEEPPVAAPAAGGTVYNSTDKRDDKRESLEERKRQKKEEMSRRLGISFADYGPQQETIAAEVEEERKDTVQQAVEPAPRRGFYGLEDPEQYADGHIKAVVHGLHKEVGNGAVIKLRLLEAVKADGMDIPRNTFVYGKLGFSSGRAMIRIENINFRDKIVPFPGSIYDRDGFEGLHVPDNVISDTKKTAAGDVVSSTNVRVNSPVAFANTAVNALGNAIKGAVSSSIREPKITISSNYLITIKPDK